MSNEQRYHLNRLAGILVTPERFCPDFKFPVSDDYRAYSVSLAKEISSFDAFVAKIERDPYQRKLLNEARARVRATL